MSNQAYVRPDGFPLWVNSSQDEGLVGNVIAYFGQLKLSDHERRMVLATKDACEGFIRGQSQQKSRAGNTLKKFKFLIDPDEGFPLHGGGCAVFERKAFIQSTVDTILTKSSTRFQSYYWRAPIGSGKTVFLKLVGKELQNRGCDVYMTRATSLDDFSSDYFIELAKEAGDKCVALLVDEVQNNMTADNWNVLLKEEKPKNLLVLGVGVPQLLGVSPQFDEKYPEPNELFPMFLTNDDLPEVTAFFEKKGFDSQVVKEVCKQLLFYTSGHLYPFVVFANYILNPNNEVDLSAISVFLTSKKFRSSAEMRSVRKRCFPFIMGDEMNKAGNILLGKKQLGDEIDLVKMGIYFRGSFISPLVVSEIFLAMPVIKKSDEVLTLDHSPERIPYIQQIVSAGLRYMEEDDFMDAIFDKVAVENAVGFRWGYNVRSLLPEIWMAPQVRLQSDERKKRGPKPLLDYLFNGRLQLGIEIALNLDADGIREHLQRFDEDYKSLKENGYVFHIDTKRDGPTVNMKPPFDTLLAQKRVYTFVKRTNALYRGSTMVHQGVAKSLPLPYPKRTFSTYAVSRTIVEALRLF